MLHNKTVVKFKKINDMNFVALKCCHIPKHPLESTPRFKGQGTQQDLAPGTALPPQPQNSERTTSLTFLIVFYSRTNGFTTKLTLNPVRFPTGNSFLFLPSVAQRIETAARLGWDFGTSYRL